VNAQRSLYVMIGIAVCLVAVAVWSVDRSNKATASATQLAADLRVIQEQQATSRVERLAACERGNKLRRKLDVSTVTSKAIAEEFAAWLATSAEFREAQGEIAGAAESRAAKRRVEGLAVLLVPTGEIDCEAVIP
jgi:hypothetical protein